MVYVHVHIPKTGGQAMRRSLQKASVELLKGHHRTARLYSLDKKWSSVLFSFAVVRNPWDALVSYVSYHSKHNGALPIDVFENWARKSIEDAILIRKDPIKAVQSPHAVDQFYHIIDENKNILVDKVYRFEDYEFIYSDVSKQLGTTLKYTHINQSSHLPYQDYYTPDLIELVRDFNAELLNCFEYVY